MDRVFNNGPADRGSILSHVIKKTKKEYLMPPCLILRIIIYVSRVKWSNYWKGVMPSLHLSVGTIEGGTLGSISTTVAKLTLYALQSW